MYDSERTGRRGAGGGTSAAASATRHIPRMMDTDMFGMFECCSCSVLIIRHIYTINYHFYLIITTVLASTLGGGGLAANANTTIVVSNDNCIGSDLIFTTVLFSSGPANKQVSVHVNAITSLGFEIIFMNGGNTLITESFKIGFWLVHSFMSTVFS